MHRDPHPPLDIGMLRDKWSSRCPDFFTVFRLLIIELDRVERDYASVSFLMSWAEDRRERIDWTASAFQLQRVISTLENSSYYSKTFLKYTKWLLDDPSYGVRTNIRKDNDLVRYLSLEYINKLPTIFETVYSMMNTPNIRLAYTNDMYEKLGFEDRNNPNEMYTDTSGYNFCMVLMNIVRSNYRLSFTHHRDAICYFYGSSQHEWYDEGIGTGDQIRVSQLRALVESVLD